MTKINRKLTIKIIRFATTFTLIDEKCTTNEDEIRSKNLIDNKSHFAYHDER